MNAYDAIVVFSGDGLFFEAINGLLRRPDGMTVLKKCPLGTLPGGESTLLKARQVVFKDDQDCVLSLMSQDLAMR